MDVAREAIESIATRAAQQRARAEERWTTSGPGAISLDHGVRLFTNAGRLTVNFHPDRVSRTGHIVSSGLAADGFYRSQWISGVSAGSRSAITGGERWRFERDFFDGAYASADASSGAHPVYGTLDLVFDDHGGAPRFGSSFLVLEPHVRARTTLCVGDSHTAPGDVGTFVEPKAVLAALAEQAHRSELLNRGLGVDTFVEVLEGHYRSPGPSRDLDGYVEAQVHGGVSLADDVSAVVLDPSFHGTLVERHITTAADTYGLDVSWHAGSEIDVADVPADFRGPTMPALAAEVARPDGVVDAAAIGVALVGTGWEEPTAHGDTQHSPRQQLKYLWHTLLAYGRDAAR